MAELEYQTNLSPSAPIVQQGGTATRIIIPMPRPYAPAPRWLRDADLLGVLIASLWSIAALLVRKCLHLKDPPRAVFDVGQAQFRMTLTDPHSGEVSKSEWPRASVVEARANRYERGLWVHVDGHVKDTYLAELPRECIEQLEAALAAAFSRWPVQ